MSSCQRRIMLGITFYGSLNPRCCSRRLHSWMTFAPISPLEAFRTLSLGATPHQSSTGSSLIQLQGVSDAIAFAYAEQHGYARWADIDAGLRPRPSCPKLRSYWQFDECGYRK